VPTLYVVPTPIGNLEDITLRALRVLRGASLILAEDTRHTRKLLSHYSIRVPLRSYHQHNKTAGLDRILEDLRSGDVALVSDAGTPALADPGFELIQAARRSGVEVDVLPGASAVVTAVVAAAIPAPGFLFAGFLPRKRAERRHLLESWSRIPYTAVAYESPHRLLATLADVEFVMGDRLVVVARELTKVHQEVISGTPRELAARFQQEAPRGEITLLVQGASEDTAENRQEDALEDMRMRAEAGEKRAAAIRAVIDTFGVTRNEAYRMWLDVGPRDDDA
jgi:16S rRNA (cytidine1402-2'-O)-methyltransferase